MIYLEYDIGEDFVEDLATFSQKLQARVMRETGRRLREGWMEMVRGEVSPRLAGLYDEALSQPVVVDSTVMIELDLDHHPAVAVVERGAAKVEMKEKLLSSPKAKRGASGRYIDVPMEHDDPRIKNARTPFPTSLLRTFRAVEPGAKIIPSRATEWGNLAGLTKSLGEYKSANNVPRHRFEGVTFRRVSEKSAAWIRPAQPAHNFADRAEQSGPRVLEAVFMAEIEKGRV